MSNFIGRELTGATARISSTAGSFNIDLSPTDEPSKTLMYLAPRIEIFSKDGSRLVELNLAGKDPRDLPPYGLLAVVAGFALLILVVFFVAR